MPDISMCKGGDCPKKESCYRYTARPSEFRQSYFAMPPWEKDGKCSYYWPIEEEIAKTKKKKVKSD